MNCPVHNKKLFPFQTQWGNRYDCPVGHCTVSWWGLKGTTPADAITRDLRARCHGLFDWMWSAGRLFRTRSEAYRWLRTLMGMTEDECHFGKFVASECLLAIRLMEGELTMEPEEIAFQKSLDENPEESLTRLVFADWLDERKDRRASGYRALGMIGAYPWKPDETRNRWWFWTRCFDDDGPALDEETELPEGTLHGLPQPWQLAYMYQIDPQETKRGFSVELISRQETEDAAALAFLMLDAGMREKLLRGELS